MILASGGAQAADLGIKAFFGNFQGGGVAENDDSLYFGVTARDFDVDIQPTGQGFSVKWTSVIRGGAPCSLNSWGDLWQRDTPSAA